MAPLTTKGRSPESHIGTRTTQSAAFRDRPLARHGWVVNAAISPGSGIRLPSPDWDALHHAVQRGDVHLVGALLRGTSMAGPLSI